ncbi:MAG: quinol monooxygenase YgiN [Flavobacterium sp.]
MIVVNATVHTNEEAISAMTAAITKMEQASRAEAGCLDYTFSVELSEPHKLRITERWDSMEVLAAHFSTPHMADFQSTLGKHPPEELTVHFYEATEFTPPGF